MSAARNSESISALSICGYRKSILQPAQSIFFREFKDFGGSINSRICLEPMLQQKHVFSETLPRMVDPSEAAPGGGLHPRNVSASTECVVLLNSCRFGTTY